MRKLVGTILLASALALSAPAVPVVTQRQVNSLTKKWLSVLRLNDWQIQTHIVRLEELKAGTAGASHINHALKVAHIMVLDPRDYKAMAVSNGVLQLQGNEIANDIEDTIIHELVHIRLNDVGKGNDAELLEEMLVVRITKALEAANK